MSLLEYYTQKLFRRYGQNIDLELNVTFVKKHETTFVCCQILLERLKMRELKLQGWRSLEYSWRDSAHLDEFIL